MQEAIAVDIKQRAAELVAQLNTFQDPKMGVFVKPVENQLQNFQRLVNNSGFPITTGLIQQIDIDSTPQYIPAGNALIAAVNQKNAMFGFKPDAGSLEKLKANIATLVSQWAAIEDAIQRYSNITDYADTLQQYAQRSDNIFNLQTQLNNLSRSLINAGAAANCVAQGMPLPAPYDRPSIGTWYAGKTITVELKQGTRIPLFDLSGIQATTGVPITRDPATTKPVITGPQDASASVAKTSFEVHNTYHLQLAAGFMRSWFHDVKYQLFQRTVTSGGSTTTQNFFAQTRDNNYRFLATIDLIYYPFAREFFPRKKRYEGDKRPAFWKEIGALAGFSITDPTKDFFFGGAWVPRSGIGVQTGLHLGYVDRLPAGISLNTPISADVTPVSQKLDHAWFIGVIMHMQVFKDVFQVIFKK